MRDDTKWTAKGEGIETIETLQTAWLDGVVVEIRAIYHDADGVKRAWVTSTGEPMQTVPFNWLTLR